MNGCGSLAIGVIVLSICLLVLQLALLVATRGKRGWRDAARGWELTAQSWQETTQKWREASEANERWAKAERGLAEQRAQTVQIWKDIARLHGYQETSDAPVPPHHLN